MYILFDIGGSKMRVAASSDCRKFSEPLIVRTPKNFKEGIRAFGALIKSTSPGKKIKAIAGGLPGYFDKEKTKIMGCAPNLNGWIGKPLKKKIQEITKSPVYLENDSDLVGLGEAVSGAGRGYEIVAYLTVSTGVGGGRIVNGKIDTGRFGFEPGNQYIDYKNKKDLEDLIGGRSVEKKYHKKPYEILDKKFWDKMAEILAYGVNNTIVHWSPDAIVIGGSMMKKIGIKIPRVELHLKKIMRAFPNNLPKIKKATLGDFGGLYGAMARIRQR